MRWRRAAGHVAVGTWLAEAADAYLDGLHRAGRPVPLSWTRGRLQVVFWTGSEVEMKGWLAPPFGLFRGTVTACASYRGRHRFTLVHLPSRRFLATLRTARQCQSLASDLARLWVRWGGNEPF